MRSSSATADANWSEESLVQRVVKSLEYARQFVASLADADFDYGSGIGAVGTARGVIGDKLVAETAMLLHCIAPIQGVDGRIAALVDDVANRLLVRARSHQVLAAICLDPGHALDHAVAHILLSRLGYRDTSVDELLANSLAVDDESGPERLPHRQLERHWLKRVGGLVESARDEPRWVKASFLGRPLDVLGCGRLDVYAFTHAVMYASDFGQRRVALPRHRVELGADAISALGQALDTDDFDLTAELLLTWPMLGLRWHPAAVFALRVLADLDDELGFLPGLSFDAAHREALDPAERPSYKMATCYHAIYVMAFLCAQLIRPGNAPSSAIPPARKATGAAGELLSLIGDGGTGTARRWNESIRSLRPRQQDALSPLVLAVALRRGRTSGDLGLLRATLGLAIRHGLAGDRPSAQAAALLRRSQLLDLAVVRRPIEGKHATRDAA